MNKPQPSKKSKKIPSNSPGTRDDKDIIIANQKQEILRLRKKVKNQEAKLIALGH